MKILWQRKGFKKRRGGRLFYNVAPCLNATDYKEPSLIIEIDEFKNPASHAKRLH